LRGRGIKVWEKVVQNPKLILLVMVIFFIIIFLWDRGFDPEGVFVPPDLSPEVEVKDYRESEYFEFEFYLDIEDEAEEDLFHLCWEIEAIPLSETEDLEFYAVLPLQFEEYIVEDEAFPRWLRSEEDVYSIEAERNIIVEEDQKETLEMAGWFNLILIWEDGQEYLEVKMKREEIEW